MSVRIQNRKYQRSLGPPKPVIESFNVAEDGKGRCMELAAMLRRELNQPFQPKGTNNSGWS